MHLLPQLANLESAMRSLGQELLDWRSNDQDARFVHEKKGLKLEADRRCHRHLVEVLQREFPNTPIISEEDASHDDARPKRYWLIDPIDGTASWLNGFDGFVTQAALIEGEDPIAGLVSAPALDKFYIAAKGEGAYLNGEPMAKMTPRDGLIAVDNTPEPHGITLELMNAVGCSQYIESGSLGLKSCLVADGSADMFVKDVVIRDWDLAPAKCIFDELGAVLVNLDGSPYRFGGEWEKSGGFIAARSQEIANRISKAALFLAANNEAET